MSERVDVGWPTWRYFSRLICFRPWLWGPNLASIILLIVLETVPGLLSRTFFDWLATDVHHLEPLWWVLALLALSTVGQVAFLVGCQLTNAPFIYTSAALLQHNMLRRLFQLPGARALPHSSGEALSRFRDDVEETAIFLIPCNDLLAWSVFALVGLVLMVSVSPTITLGVFVPLVAISGLLHLGRTRIEAYRRAVRGATAKVTAYLADVFSAPHTIQLASAEGGVIAGFRELNHVRLQTAIRDRLLDQVLQSVSRNTSNIGTGVILLLASRAMEAGTFTVGDFALFVFYLGWVGEFTGMFGLVLAKYRQAGVSFGRMGELMRGSSPQVLVEHQPVFEPGPQPRRENATPLDMLEVSNLTYLHPASGRGIRDVTLRVDRGQCVIVTGRVGAGKTTLLRALLGLLPPQAGVIRWNGYPVDDPASFLIPPRCAYTPQLPRLFSETLRNNLLLDLQPAESLEALQQALRVSQFETDLGGLRDGLESEVGPRGVALSGGQLQRAAAARMLVRQPELLVLDDLSSLDGPTEAAFWAGLRADPSATILAASHRRAALERADRILVLQDGAVIDEGPLEVLLVRCEEMRRLWLQPSP